MTDDDSIHNPPHYTQGNIECIEAIEAALTPEEFKGFLKGNVFKYIWRERIKDGASSLKKAKWYLDRMNGVHNKQDKIDAMIDEHQLYLDNNGLGKLIGATNTFPHASKAIFDNCDLFGYNFNCRLLAFASFVQADLRKASFQGSDLENADLTNAKLENASGFMARLQGAKLIRANASESFFRKANFQYADLRNSNFHGAVLQDSDFSHADLTEADFSCTLLEGVNFSCAKIDGVNWDDSKGQEYIKF